MSSFCLLFMLVAMCAVEALHECTKPGFWKRISSPACAVLYDEEDCQGDSTELSLGSRTNGTARSATIRPGCYLYEGNTILGLENERSVDSGRYKNEYIALPARNQFWTSNDNRSHEVSCQCFTSNADALACNPSEEWILIATHDNRKYSVASLFEYKYVKGYLIGQNGVIVHFARSQLFYDVLRFNGLKTLDSSDEGVRADKILVPAKSCAFVLQDAYRCDRLFYLRSNVEVRLQDTASTNGGTQPCNLDYASAVPADAFYGE